ncbi:MAG: hypothetical protein K9M02_04060 [Thiohalocapsa sp.]|nr:hypothetical protein [Thiohalocapsa sp.]
MLRSLAVPEGYVLEAIDDDIGKCADFLFDDRDWAVRYLVADTSRWLHGRKVLISPAQIGRPDWETRRIPVLLTREQIEQSPPLDSDAPISRRYEHAFNVFYALPHYWLGSGVWGDYPLPSSMTAEQQVRIEPRPSEPKTPAVAPQALEETEHVHLRSLNEVSGYHVRCVEDGTDVGRVVDMIADDVSWQIKMLALDTSRLPFSRKVLLPVEWVESIDWVDNRLLIGVGPDLVEEAPEFDPSEPVNIEQETVLFDYYGRPRGRARD